jgi:hypothetical protein
MRWLAAALILCVSPAHAGDSAYWGATGCRLVPVEGAAHVAELRCENFLTAMTDPNVSAELQAGDLVVHLSLMQTVGRVPDEFSVTVPDGFIALPPVMSLDEETAGVVLVMPWLGY